jgi:hypothetical protein
MGVISSDYYQLWQQTGLVSCSFSTSDLASPAYAWMQSNLQSKNLRQ